MKELLHALPLFASTTDEEASLVAEDSVVLLRSPGQELFPAYSVKGACYVMSAGGFPHAQARCGRAEGGIDDYALWGVITLRASSACGLRASKLLLWSQLVEQGFESNPPAPLLNQKAPAERRGLFGLTGGEGGIRTLDTLLTYTPLAGERLRPLGHFSGRAASYQQPLSNQLFGGGFGGG